MNNPVRLDKWLWAARFFKTRSLATQAIASGRVAVNEASCKASREIRVGDCITLRREGDTLVLNVRATAATRGPASVARLLYEETAASMAERERLAVQRRLAPEPAATIEQGRPTKRNRRSLAQWQRWSASADD
jgi:ribosome-associated heat shock protein Hsp15